MTVTKLIGAAVIGGKDYVLYVSLTDGTAGEITVRDRSGTLVNLKDTFPGQVMTEFWMTIGTPSDLDLVQFKGPDGGIIYEWGGCIDAALGQNPELVVTGISAKITKGCAFEATTSD